MALRFCGGALESRVERARGDAAPAAAAQHPQAGPLLALSSTLAGNLLIVGSIANIIVVDQAGRLGVKISWREHARIGIPVTLLTLGVAAAWLWLRAA